MKIRVYLHLTVGTMMRNTRPSQAEFHFLFSRVMSIVALPLVGSLVAFRFCVLVMSLRQHTILYNGHSIYL